MRGARRGRRPRRLRRGALEERRAPAARRALRRLRRATRSYAAIAARAELVARWTNVARELVDAPPNVVTPDGPRRARGARCPASASRSSTRPTPACPRSRPSAASSAPPPRLIVLRHEPAGRPDRPRLALVGKSVTFDAGGYFLKPQSDIVRQKGDMAGGAAVLAALGAIAELGLPLDVIGVLAGLREHDRPGRDPPVGRHHDRRRASPSR